MMADQAIALVEENIPQAQSCQVRYVLHALSTLYTKIGHFEHNLEDKVMAGRKQYQLARIIGLEDLFVAGMRQLAVADEKAEPPGIEKRDMFGGNAV